MRFAFLPYGADESLHILYILKPWLAPPPQPIDLLV